MVRAGRSRYRSAVLQALARDGEVFMLIAFFIALFLVGSTSEDADVMIGSIRSLLSLKGTTYPYSAEYELALPPEPRIAGTTEKRRIFAERPDILYSEQATSCQRVRTLVSARKLLFEYSDSTNRRALCVGSLDLGHKTSERWLEDHGFVFNSYSSIDRDLISLIGDLIRSSKVTGHDVAGTVHTYHLSRSRLGDLVITLGPKRVEINAIGKDSVPEKSKTIFSYTYHDGGLPWSAEAISDLKDDFTKAGDKVVQQLVGEFNMDSALQQCFPRAGEIRLISLEESKVLAVCHGYLLPASPPARIIEIRDFSGQLHLKVKFNGKIYSIGQYPAVSRIRDDKSLAPFEKGRRKLGDYTVLDISDSRSESNYIYYLKDGVALLVQDPEYKHIPFLDHNLDRLIESFSAFVGPKQGRS
jgi:hypothetical protein